MALPKVVVVGGGPGGVSAAQSLAGSADVTLIERQVFTQVDTQPHEAFVLPESCLSLVSFSTFTCIAVLCRREYHEVWVWIYNSTCDSKHSVHTRQNALPPCRYLSLFD